jgi:NADH dehydrogenase
MKVFIAGGTGFVGSHVVARLLERGCGVFCLVHNTETANLPTPVRIIHGDATKPAGLAEGLKGVDAVINLIGIIRSYSARGVTFRRLHVETTQNLLQAAKSAGVKRFIQMSANGARQDGSTEYQRTKFEAEELVKFSGLDWTIFRPSIIFGPPPAGRIEFCTQLSGILRSSPFVPVFGDGNYRLQPVHVDDVASCFISALYNTKSSGRIFHLGGDETLSYNSILDLICLGMGVPPRRKIFVPWSLARPFVAFMGMFPFFPATAYQIDMLLEGNVIPEKEFKEFFGVKPREFSSETLSYLRLRRSAA